MGRPAMWQLDQTSSCFQLNELNSISERDNARVNRADEKCKLVKTESDTVGACDHPTTGQPHRCGRFGSTFCYPYSRMICRSYPIGSANRSRACHGCQWIKQASQYCTSCTTKIWILRPSNTFRVASRIARMFAALIRPQKWLFRIPSKTTE